MEFFAVNGKRPIRLCQQTRRFAYESLHHKYGKETWQQPGVSLDDIDAFETLSALQKYDLAITRIAEQAPLRICPQEKISGAATLGLAIGHLVPATRNGSTIFYSTSHLTLDFETVLKKGVNYIWQQAEESLKRHKGTEKEAFLNSCLNCLQAMKIWHNRYLQALQGLPGYEANYENLKNVPFRPATNFYEAVQSLWFTFAFTRLCGNWPGIGRLDYLLGSYLEKDLQRGALTLEDAREILAHFFIKGCEWIKGGDCGSGDAQHYQNIVLCGVDETGKEITNTVTYLTLEILEELGISDFPTTVRINKNTDVKLLNRVAEVIRLGGGVIAIYNEDLIIESLVNYGYALTEARKFANDGCWEIQIPGKTYFSYIPFDSLQILQKLTLSNSYGDFEALYRAFIAGLKNKVDEIMAQRHQYAFANTTGPAKDWTYNALPPCTVVSLFEQGCIEKGISYNEGGPVYNVVSPHIGGLPDAVNSLYAIKKLVFDDHKCSFGEFMRLLKSDWQGNEALRLYALNHYTYFGNDHDEVDFIARDIINDFAQICDSLNSPYKTPAGVSTFGRQLEWSQLRKATSYGKKSGDILAGNFSPTPGTDKKGATAIIKSYCKADLKRTVSGAALDIKLLPSAVNGENGTQTIAALIQGFVALGGHFMQPDIADRALLLKAQEHPEEYSNLSVRVSGWNARFVTLSKDWQDMIIAQTGSEL